jgi:hypothetical protein
VARLRLGLGPGDGGLRRGDDNQRGRRSRCASGARDAHHRRWRRTPSDVVLHADDHRSTGHAQRDSDSADWIPYRQGKRVHGRRNRAGGDARGSPARDRVHLRGRTQC